VPGTKQSLSKRETDGLVVFHNENATHGPPSRVPP
jgi:hypothetical protein